MNHIWSLKVLRKHKNKIMEELEKKEYIGMENDRFSSENSVTIDVFHKTREYGPKARNDMKAILMAYNEAC